MLLTGPCTADSCTAAITGDGQLLTWGEASTDSLGYSGVQRQYIPRPVAGPLSDNVVVQVRAPSQSPPYPAGDVPIGDPT